jgi:hypothetical protein
MAGTLDELAQAVTALREALIDRLEGHYKDVALAEYSPLLSAANFASAAAVTLREFCGRDDPWAMFNAMEHGATSISNLVIVLRVIETVG